MSKGLLGSILGKCKNFVAFGLHGQETKLELDRTHSELTHVHSELTRAHTELNRVHSELNRAHSELNRAHSELNRAQNAINARSTELIRIRDLYLNLITDCLAGIIYEDAPLDVLGQKQYDPQLREYGWDWPSKAHTMIGSKRLANIRVLAESVLGHEIEGDFMETGVWRGGACIMMRAVLEAYGDVRRSVWLADSFEGLPAPSPEQFPADKGEIFHEYKELQVSIDVVKQNFTKYHLLDDQVKFIKGWFKDTLPTAPVEKLALLRLDGDLYESTIQPLNALYHKVSVGGYIIVDDYHVVKGCKDAIHDFLDTNNLSPVLNEIDGVGVYWQKTE